MKTQTNKLKNNPEKYQSFKQSNSLGQTNRDLEHASSVF